MTTTTEIHSADRVGIRTSEIGWDQWSCKHRALSTSWELLNLVEELAESVSDASEVTAEIAMLVHDAAERAAGIVDEMEAIKW